MRALPRHDRHDSPRHGLALTQWLVVLPVLAVLVLGVVELGRAITVGQLVTNAASEGCRRAIQDGATETIVAETVKQLLATATNVGPSDVQVTVEVLAQREPKTLAQARPRDLVAVTVSVPFARVSYLPPTLLNTLHLTARSTQRHE